MAPPRVPSRKLPMMVSRLPPLTRTMFAAVLLSFGMALTGLGAACDSEPPPLPADKRLDAMIGQMIMVGFLGDHERDPGVKAVRDQLAKGIVGGVVLYPENIGSPNELRSLTAFLRNAKSAMVPFIAVDQEGGKVQRLTPRNGHRYFPSAWSVGRNPAMPRPTAPSGSMRPWPMSWPMPASISISARWSISTSIPPIR